MSMDFNSGDMVFALYLNTQKNIPVLITVHFMFKGLRDLRSPKMGANDEEKIS